MNIKSFKLGCFEFFFVFPGDKIGLYHVNDDFSLLLLNFYELFFSFDEPWCPQFSTLSPSMQGGPAPVHWVWLPNLMKPIGFHNAFQSSDER